MNLLMWNAPDHIFRKAAAFSLAMLNAAELALAAARTAHALDRVEDLEIAMVTEFIGGIQVLPGR